MWQVQSSVDSITSLRVLGPAPNVRSGAPPFGHARAVLVADRPSSAPTGQRARPRRGRWSWCAAVPVALCRLEP
jgi:hypothetical protein